MTTMKTTMTKEKRAAVYLALASVKDSYGSAGAAFPKFLEETNRDLSEESVLAYIDSLDGVDEDGKRLAAATKNLRKTAMTSRIRVLLDQLPSMSALGKWNVERVLKKIPRDRINPGVSPDRYPSSEEVEKFVRESKDKKLALLVEFLANTGLRIAEALGILLSDIDPNAKHVRIRIVGKGKKERWVVVPKKLVDRINERFHGKTWLFEHQGKQFSQTGVCNRVKYQSLLVLGKPYTPHSFRHYFATNWIPKIGAKKVANYLGHSSVATTLAAYDHSVLKYEDLYGNDEGGSK